MNALPPMCDDISKIMEADEHHFQIKSETIIFSQSVLSFIERDI